MKLKNILKHGFCGLALLAMGHATAQTWEMKQAPLMTQWSEEVKNNPEGAFTSYPRPQMVRDNWVNLNGVWDLAKYPAPIIPTAFQGSVKWMYITGGEGFTVPGNWNSDLNYDETDWSEGTSGFGQWQFNTNNWTTETIYLRKKVNIPNLTTDELANLKLDIFHDEDFELYINGVLAASGISYTSEYTKFDIAPAAKSAIVLNGENLVAIKCIQKTGWQYIDAGLFVDGPTKTFGTYYSDQTYNQKILVPFPIESALSGIMDKDYTNRDKWYTYKREFTVPANMQGKDILLHFGAVDWRCKVFVNGTEVGLHEGGYDPFSFNVTSALQGTGAQELVVQVYDPSSAGGQPRGKQYERPHTIQYTPASGIWQTVWFESVNSTYIKDFRITPDVDNEKVVINVEAENATANTKVKITILNNGAEVVSTEGNLNTNVELAIPNPVLWDTENPFLYDVKFELKNDAQLVDEVSSYFGMRKISIGKVNEFPWVFLNNKPIFQYGTLDQGYWPDGLYSAPNEEALIFDIKKTKEYGFNMIRKHIKTEPAIWYHACDTMGMLVWQDMPNSDDGFLGDRDWQKNQFYKELKAMMHALKNTPSIVTWVIYNEAWGQFDNGGDDSHTKEGVRIAREMDNSRLINSVSGWTDYGIGDLFDRHSYPNPGIYTDGRRASVCGETGGVSLIDVAHQWSPPEMEYIVVDTPEELQDMFISFVEESKALQASGMCAAVYTQITDVEMEPNGLLFYDRVMKSTPQQVEAMKNAIQSAININDGIYTVVVKPANLEASEWKYTTTQPVGEWTTTAYDDNTWSTGLGGFGGAKTGNPPAGAVIRTSWLTNNIWLRRNITLDLTNDNLESLKALVYYDEDFELYINGVPAASTQGYSTSYRPFDISAEAKAAINLQGENTIAIHCLQKDGGQYIDFGLMVEVPLSDLSVTDVTTQNQDRLDILVFPNPAADMLYFAVNDAINIQKVSLYDLGGALVKTVSGHSTSVNISALNKGVYILKIETDTNSCVKRIIKN